MSKLTAFKNIVTSRTSRQLLKVQKHSPVILFAVGVAGMVGTVVLASKATLKVDKILNEHELDKEMSGGLLDAVEAGERPGTDYTKEDYQKDMVLLYLRTASKLGKLYAPALACGVVSIAALTGSHYILNSRNVALTAAYAAIEKGYHEYRSRVVNELGEDKDRQFATELEMTEVVETKANGKTVTTQVATGVKGTSPYAAIFDETNKNWNRHSEYNRLFIQCQQQYANDLLRARGHVFLNDVRDMLGLERIPAGQIGGWVQGPKEGDHYIDFGVFRGDTWMAQQFVNGDEQSVILDFNVDGPVWDKI